MESSESDASDLKDFVVGDDFEIPMANDQMRQDFNKALRKIEQEDDENEISIIKAALKRN